MTPRRRGFVLFGLLIAGLLALAGCGGGDGLPQLSPATGAAPSRSASGKRRPACSRAVVLPAPGAPMNPYHGSW